MLPDDRIYINPCLRTLLPDIYVLIAILVIAVSQMEIEASLKLCQCIFRRHAMKTYGEIKVYLQ
jgi:hypothetical protein